MFAICIESSLQKGMGHLFRMLNLIAFLETKRVSFKIFINNDVIGQQILTEKYLPFIVVDLEDESSDWESSYIHSYNIKYWINDRLNTSLNHSRNVKKNNIALITFDDTGEGAKISDINIVTLPSMQKNILYGKKVLTDINYFIFNQEIKSLKKQRNTIHRIGVSLGGSDSYGVTLKVLEKLKELHIGADIHIGPSFSYREELETQLTNDYSLIINPDSLIKEFSTFDLMISGGGITPFEANALGIPCLIIANEYFECDNAEFLQSFGSSKFMGYHTSIDWQYLQDYKLLNIREMSHRGLLLGQSSGTSNIYHEIISL